MGEKNKTPEQENKERIDLGSDKKSLLKQEPEKVIKEHNDQKSGKSKAVTWRLFSYLYTCSMNTLLVTNILLAAIVLVFIIIGIMMAILLGELIGVTQKIKHIVTVFDDDVIRARSVVSAIKDILSEKLFGKHKK